ncbi:glycosyltransferase [Actinomadura rifamycini]|uniref:glycosyltransferase n=1 Tax=Actinomadura rifamycini TaxID=31962 RepID=UPI0003F6A40D|nr:glycosyltransferase [Actinomadura rifamycini]
MRALLVSYGSRGDVQPLAGLALRLRDLGVEARVCAPPDEEFAALFAGIGVPLVPFGPSVRGLVTRKGPPADSAAALAAEMVAAHFGPVAAAAEGCDAVLAAGMLPAGVRSVAEKRGVPYVYACYHPFSLPSPHYPPLPRAGRPHPAGAADNRSLWDADAAIMHGLYGAPLNAHRSAAGLPPVDDVCRHAYTDRPWLAADPVLGPWGELPDPDVVQTGAWVLPDDRPLPPELAAFLDAGTPPVYVGFGSMPMSTPDATRTAVEAARALGRRVVVSSGWADRDGVAAGDDCLAVGETNLQALFGRVAAVVHRGGAGTTWTAARAGAPQVVVPQLTDERWWAAQVAELGIGAAEDPAPTFASLSAALGKVLTPGTAARAKAAADTVRTDGAAVAARLLRDLIGN